MYFQIHGSRMSQRQNFTLSSLHLPIFKAIDGVFRRCISQHFTLGCAQCSDILTNYKVALRMCLGKERTGNPDLLCTIPAQPLWLPKRHFSWPWRMEKKVQLHIRSNSRMSELCMLAQCDGRIKGTSGPQGRGFLFHAKPTEIKP